MKITIKYCSLLLIIIFGSTNYANAQTTDKTKYENLKPAPHEQFQKQIQNEVSLAKNGKVQSVNLIMQNTNIPSVIEILNEGTENERYVISRAYFESFPVNFQTYILETQLYLVEE